jgi:hypothetical protein
MAPNMTIVIYLAYTTMKIFITNEVIELWLTIPGKNAIKIIVVTVTRIKSPSQKEFNLYIYTLSILYCYLL